MAAWLPVVKSAIPVIADIVSIATPMLTKKKAVENQDALTTQQIEELQVAATQNAESVKLLASEVKTTFEGLESAAADLQQRLNRLQVMTTIAAFCGASGLLLSTYLLLSS